MFRSVFDKNLDNATSHLQLEPDWPSILVICDEINQKDVSPKTAFAAIKKKMNSPNPHSACYALLVLESVVKNCGAPIHDEVFTKENCEMFSTFLESTPHETVKAKMLELVQTWAHAFRSTDKYQSIKDIMTILKAKGHPFPELKEADAMFTAESAPTWADGPVCHRCRTEFTLTNRKHHCRNCGQIFCNSCSSHTSYLPKYGIEKEVRVCDGCYMELIRPTSKTGARTAAGDSDLPAVYLNSSLSQQVQTPPRKTEQELKEEEELQLALALSQSEAEQKKKHQTQSSMNYRMQQRSPSPEQTAVPKEYVQQEEANPDLAKYLNRTYWEQRKINESAMASPSAPSPMPTPTPTPQPQLLQSMSALSMQPKSSEELKVDEFSANMRTQVDIFVNRMKSNSARGRSICNDSAISKLITILPTMHSQQLAHIKELDDKRMWYEQLQDKLIQIKDSRAALDVLRQEHIEKLRLIAEEQERQRQIQMAQKLDIMRKKKQEYLQYQRQLALQRIQDQEREMQMRQEQQMAQYRMGQNATAFPYMQGQGMAAGATNSPSHQMPGATAGYHPYGGVYNPSSPVPYGMPVQHGMYGSSQAGMVPPQQHQTQMMHHAGMMPQSMGQSSQNSGMATNSTGIMHADSMMGQNNSTAAHNMPVNMQQQQPPSQPSHVGMSPTFQQQNNSNPQHGHIMQQQQQQSIIQNQTPMPNVANNANAVASPQHQQLQQQINQTTMSANQIQAVAAAPMPPQSEPEPSAAATAAEPATAELISFD